MYSFSKQLRLKSAEDFASVFILKKRINGNWFNIYYKKNNSNKSRLGLIISKKNHKRSNKRNYMKRIMRELFRLNQPHWSGYDIIIKTNKCFIKDNYLEIKHEFMLHTQRFLVK
ncbi:MAG: ribonuclease P protein component [Burkholderiales bacterium]|nr:ribonuclease P protein component [Burkholderiales bacterium]